MTSTKAPHFLARWVSSLALLLVIALIAAGGPSCKRRSAPPVPAPSVPLPPHWSEEEASWGARARIASPEIDECSGIVQSRRYPGVFWVHNDSKDTARIFAIDSAGGLLRQFSVLGTQHVDWEDITIDDAGNLYLCDVGNNRSDRRDLAVYVVPEPDPDRDTTVRAARTLRLHYPDQVAFPDPHKNHDCEAVIWRDGHLYFLTKHRTDSWTRLYRLENLESSADQPLSLIDSLEVGSMVTAADLSPDGSELAVLSYDYLFIFELGAEGDPLLSAGRASRLLFEARQSEGVSHNGSVIMVTNEQGEIHLLDRQAVLDGSERFSPVTGDWAPARDGPAAPAALRYGYRPARRSATVGAGSSVPLSLRAAAGEKREPAPGPGQMAEAQLRCEGDGLHIELSWVAPVTVGEETARVMILAWGALSDRTSPGESGQVWEILSRGGRIEAERAAGRSGPPPELELVRRGDRIAGAITLPSSPGVPCPPAALNLNLFAPGGGEWCWGGDWSMRGAFSPFLWGQLTTAR